MQVELEKAPDVIIKVSQYEAQLLMEIFDQYNELCDGSDEAHMLAADLKCEIEIRIA